ncbi:hypothetical protein [Enterococcus faecium]|uniref:Uncharacterized protein n=1 Tax=Enterococcus faecium TaxID=1352 RepID=A0A9X3XS98_ENTFC|nr:hypothetical protein [Enterococcus faecium]MDC4248091.1 hypothetical protein [Enterococcus faecium]
MLQTEKEFQEAINYLLQLPEKLSRQLQGTYKTNSNEEWELLYHTYEEEPVGCDYKNCPRADPKNGIKEVFHVRNKKTGEQLRVGSDCYLKLIYGKEKLTKEEKEESKRLLRKTKKMEAELFESIQETKQCLRETYYSFKTKLERLENPSFSEALMIAEEQFNQADSIEELKRLAKLLEIYYHKFLRELENTKLYGKHVTRTGIVKYYVKETGERLF